MFRSSFLVLASSLAAAAAVGACTGAKHDPTPSPKDAPVPSGAATLSNGDGGTAAAASGSAAAAGSANAANAPGAKDAGAPAPYDGPLLGALFLSTPVMSEMEWPKEEDKKKGDKSGSVRIGYIRQGSKVPVVPEAHVKPNCKEGWYELVQGGFVCGKYATLDMNHPRIKLAPHPPSPTDALPYQYGYNVINGTPLYRTIPSHDERAKLEPWFGGRKAKPKPKDDDSSNSASSDDADAGASGSTSGITRVSATQSSEDLDAGTPWYLKEYDGGKPQITLDDLKGDGPIARRMVKGFYLALDKDFSSNGSRWWKTTGGLLAPFNAIYVQTKASEFHGVWFDSAPPGATLSVSADAVDAGAPAATSGDGGAAGASSLASMKKATPDVCKTSSKQQIGVILWPKARKYILATSRKTVTAGDAVSRHSIVRLTGDSVVVGGASFDETDEGWWMRAIDGTKTQPGDPPKDLQPGEKWIDVNLKRQTLVAYEGDKPVFATAVSTGKENKEDEEKDHHTPPGTFRIREKHIAATMDGDVASDGPYSIEDVPWIMYFNGSYALHGAFWHNNFGHQQSHGCVNLAPQDAKALFGWTEPHLPDGWHGVMSTAEKPGTRVVVHE